MRTFNNQNQIASLLERKGYEKRELCIQGMYGKGHCIFVGISYTQAKELAQMIRSGKLEAIADLHESWPKGETLVLQINNVNAPFLNL